MTEQIPTPEQILKEPTLNLEQVALLITPRLDEIDKKLSEIEEQNKDTVLKFLKDLEQEAVKRKAAIWSNRKQKAKKWLSELIKYGGAGTIISAFYQIFIREY